MKRLVATLIAVVTVLMMAIVPMTGACAEETTSVLVNNEDIGWRNEEPIGMTTNEFVLPGQTESGIGEVIIGSVKYAGNFVRFLGTDLVETFISLGKDGGYNSDNFSWTKQAIEDLEAAGKMVTDNAGKALEEIKELPGTVWNGIKDGASNVKDGACWVWDKFTSLF